MHDATARGQVLPSVVLTLLSFIAFFMNPDTGERLGSGHTLDAKATRAPLTFHFSRDHPYNVHRAASEWR